MTTRSKKTPPQCPLSDEEEDFESIKNGSGLRAMKDHGDLDKIPREVRYWAYFRSDRDRSLFKAEVLGISFSIAWESHHPGQELPFGITLAKRQTADQEALDSSSKQLLRLAELFHGEYDGWETQIITQ